MSDLLIFDETREATLIDPDRPIEIEYQPPATPTADWFADRTDVNATQLMPAVKPSPESRHAA